MNITRALHLLEIERGVSLEEMRQSYRDLVRVWHPDRFEADARLRAKAAARLAEINQAYRYLQTVDLNAPEPAAPRTPSSMPDRRKRPRPVVKPRQRSWAGMAAAAAMVLVVAGLIGAARLAPSTPAPLPAPVSATSAPIVPVEPVVVAPPQAAVRNAAQEPSAPARSFFSRDLDRVLSRTSR